MCRKYIFTNTYEKQIISMHFLMHYVAVFE